MTLQKTSRLHPLFQLFSTLRRTPLMSLARQQCSVDTIGKHEEKTGENIYEYKKSVKIPPLSFIDDILALTKCGVNSVILNATINAKIQTKKLRFGPTKCHLMHVGSTNPLCPDLKVNVDDRVKKVTEDVYLGGMINEKGNNDKKLQKTRGVWGTW